MKIDCISDTHDRLSIHKLEFSDAEMLIIAGDISNLSGIEETYAIFADINKVPHEYIVFVPGNHDGYFEERTLICSALYPETRAHIVINDIVEIDGIRIGGSPMTPMFQMWHFMEHDEELATYWQHFKNKQLDILVTHGPPYGILDETEQDRCGSRTLLAALPEIAPKWHIFGHIHESYGSHSENGIEFRNVSIVDGQYIKKNPVTTIEV